MNTTPPDCNHVWVRLLPAESTTDQMVYRTLLIKMHHWKRNALICTRCGKTGYQLRGQMRENRPHEHTVLMGYVNRLATRFGISLPGVETKTNQVLQ